MSSTTDRYRRHHGDTAYAALAARSAMAGMESLAAELARRTAGSPGTPLGAVDTSGQPVRPTQLVRPTRGPIAGRDRRGHALPPHRD